MRAHSPLAHLIPRSAHSAHTRGHTLAAPRAYDAFVSLFFLGRRRASFMALIGAARVKPGQRVLDVGCGTGYFARLLSQSVGADGLVVGVDASREMIGYASRETGRASNCQFHVGTAESLSFPAEHFDVVVSSLFIHHLPADLQVIALAEMRRVLRPGGTLLVAEAHVPRAFGWRLLAHLHGYDRMAQAVPDLEGMIADAGFDQVGGGEAPPWLRYARAMKPANATRQDVTREMRQRVDAGHY
jgi:ubiquinone/menaquinone biosynthesis C-methylase UbiE